MKDIFNNSCDIVRDLLPMYADSCTSEASAKALRHHLSCCKSCRSYLISIKNCRKNNPEENVPDCRPDYSDLLKKVKHRRKIRHSLVWSLIIALITENVVLSVSRKINKKDE